MSTKKRGMKWASLALAIILFVTSLTGYGGSVGKAFAADSPNTIDNHDFETGDLTGWTKTGTAFDDGPKSDSLFWGDRPFNQQGTYHMWNWNDLPGADARTGTLQSSVFRLGGNGEVDFLIGGARNLSLYYVALVRASDGEELFKETGQALPDHFERYVRVNWDASAYIGEELYIKVVDNGDGHINVDDVNVYNMTSEISNAGFESGDLRGWQQTGDAFTGGVILAETYGEDQKPYHHIGKYHLGGGTDAGSGTLQSSLFKLGGNGQINFLVSGVKDPDNQYVALVRESDGMEIFKETGPDLPEHPYTYKRVIWDASSYIGENLYIKVVDHGAGHIAVDDFQVYNTDHDIVNPDFETGDLTGWQKVSGDDLSRLVKWEVNYWYSKPLNKHNHFSLWGDDQAIGTIRSSDFVLAGTGEINFLIGGGKQDGQYVALMKADGTEIMRTRNEHFIETEQFTRVSWDASAYLGQTLYLVIADEVAGGGWQHINADDFHVYNLPTDIVNPGFETGDLTGWSVAASVYAPGVSVMDTVYVPGRVTSDVDYWHSEPINKEGEFHFWGDDGKVGTMESTHFQLSGTGEINFLLGGGNFPYTEYVALVRESDGKELLKATHTKHSGTENYDRVVWDASSYLGEIVFIRVVDQVAGVGWQHVNVDDFKVYNTDPNKINNPGFESGSLDNWTVEGDAFAVISSTMPGSEWSDHVGTYHVYGGGNDPSIGSLTSETFKLSGTGDIDFLIGGNDDIDNQYVELVRQEDGETLLRATGEGTETYNRVVWDARAYLGQKVFIRVVDNGAGHVNVDDFRVLKIAHIPYTMPNEDFERDGLSGWSVEGNAFSAAEGETSGIAGVQRHAFATGTEEGQGMLTSGTFRLAGTGKVNFKVGGTESNDVYVGLYRAVDGKELKRISPDGSAALNVVEWDVSGYLNELLYFKVVDQSASANIHVDDFNYYVSSEIMNPGFETGDIRGWNVLEGTAFANEAIANSKTTHHGTMPFLHQGNFHIWGYQNGGDDTTGMMESSHFTLDGTGRITFLIGGGSRPSSSTLGVQLVRDSNGEVLFEQTGHDDEKYKRVDWDAKEFIGEELFFRVIDQATGGWGHINIDDVRTINPFGSAENLGFETGDTSGWTLEGDAFKQSVSNVSGFGHDGVYYLSGKQPSDDKLTGSLKTRNFELNGNGKISFLIAGGNDSDRLYAALVRTDNEEVLYKATGSNSDKFREITWDASAYVGEEVYLMVSDQKNEGPFGYISVDDFQMSTPNTRYGENYRPQYHYTPEKNWMNDPNGMVYYEGEYHLFYQHTPFSTQPDFGRMHWGHAVSKDLVHWEELAPAIAPGDDGAIFSGSAVVDKNNTSGFFNEEGSGLVAIYTNNDNKAQPGKPQVQSIAYSKDKGRTWTKYEGNPVLFPTTSLDFRDPKVIWHEETSNWIMALAVKDRVEFYTSPNLKDWTYASSFGSEIIGTHRGIYECPELFPIYVDGDPNNKKWVLLLSVGDRNGVNANDPDTPAGGSGMMYFVGSFDGKNFEPDETVDSADDVKWVDFGSDFYAAVTFSDIPAQDGRRIWMGWMNNWRYASTLPSVEWRGNMSIPREIVLKTYPEGIRLIQVPVQELQSLRKPIANLQDTMVEPGMNPTAGISAAKAEIIAEFELGTATEFGFKVRKSSDEETVVGYDVANGQLFVDRTNSGATDFHPDFAAKHEGPMTPENNRVQMTIYVDWSTLEVLGNNGKVAISDTIFPNPNSNDLEVYAVGGSVRLVSLQINDMQNIWRDETISKIRLDSREYKLNVSQTHQSIVRALSVTDKVDTLGALQTDVTTEVKYTSSNPAVAVVSASGLVTGLSEGSAMIRAYYGGYIAMANVTVQSAGGGTNPPPSSNSSGTGGITPPASEAVQDNGNGGVIVSIKAKINGSNYAEGSIRSETLQKALDTAEDSGEGTKRVTIEIASVSGADGYTLQLPVAYLTSPRMKAVLEIRTPLGTVSVNSDMLSGTELNGASTISILIGKASLARADSGTSNRVGTRPVLDINMNADGKPLSWNNPNSPVKVSVNYSPTAQEQSNLENIIVLYIDETGKASPVSNSRYDGAAGQVVFSTTHFSTYAVAYVEQSFEDLDRYPWAKKQIEALASRDIVKGSSITRFDPSGAITRADFMLMLVRTLELKAKASSHFNDAKPGDYYYEALGIAKALGVAQGSGDNNFNPKAPITRQDMMVMTARALKTAGIVGPEESADLSPYADVNKVSRYAIESISALVSQGLIQGNNSKLNPHGQATRAEAAVMMFRIWQYSAKK